MGDVKARSTLRDERAQVTRRRIAGAARALFGRRGYGATTLQAIAEEAGVAVQTVYAVYGSKAGILRDLRETVSRQPAAEALYEEAIRETDSERKLELFASSIRRRWEFGHDVVAIHRDAGATDQSVRAEVEQVLGMRRDGIARLARSLAGELRTGLDETYATAVMDALTLPEVYAALIDAGGRSPDDFEAWLAKCLKDQLLATRRTQSGSGV
jgi:AcrR family transcriptional regulator